MNDATIMTTILMLGLVIGLAINYLVGNIITQVDKIKVVMENNRLFKAKQAAVEKMKAEGDMHEWVSIMTPTGSMLVCKKTGWCPSLKGFIEVSHINRHLEDLKAEEEYKVFRAERINQMALHNDTTVEKMEKIVEQVFSIKKDFYVARIAKLQQEIEAKAAAVRDGQTKV